MQAMSQIHSNCFSSHPGQREVASVDAKVTCVPGSCRLPDLTCFSETENTIPTIVEPYFLRLPVSSRWIFGGVMTRPCVKATQCEEKFSISAMETSDAHRVQPFLNRWLSFTRVDHCFCVVEGTFKVKFRGHVEWTLIRGGQAITIPARQGFTVDVGSGFLRWVTITNGTGIDELICKAGYQCASLTLPETVSCWDGWDEVRFISACSEVGALLG